MFKFKLNIKHGIGPSTEYTIPLLLTKNKYSPISKSKTDPSASIMISLFT